MNFPNWFSIRLFTPGGLLRPADKSKTAASPDAQAGDSVSFSPSTARPAGGPAEAVLERVPDSPAEIPEWQTHWLMVPTNNAFAGVEVKNSQIW